MSSSVKLCTALLSNWYSRNRIYTGNGTLHYITLHYITLHYITLHYITLHYITLHYTIKYLDTSLLAERPEQSGLVDVEVLNQGVDVVEVESPVVVSLGLVPDLSPESLGSETCPLDAVCWSQRRLLHCLLRLVPAPLLVDLVRDHGGGSGTGGEQTVHEVRHGAGQGEHVHPLQVESEQVLGRANHDLRHTDDVHVLQLRDLGQHLGDLTQIPGE